jgi:hypothetical protein
MTVGLIPRRIIRQKLAVHTGLRIDPPWVRGAERNSGLFQPSACDPANASYRTGPPLVQIDVASSAPAAIHRAGRLDYSEQNGIMSISTL